MNVEVEVVYETVTTYLVRDVRSLEEAERAALIGRGEPQRRRAEEPFVRVSYPVIRKEEQVKKPVNTFDLGPFDEDEV